MEGRSCLSESTSAQPFLTASQSRNKTATPASVGCSSCEATSISVFFCNGSLPLVAERERRRSGYVLKESGTEHSSSFEESGIYGWSTFGAFAFFCFIKLSVSTRAKNSRYQSDLYISYCVFIVMVTVVRLRMRG